MGLLTPDRATFERPAPVVAPLLLGAHLRHRTADGDVTVRITEVEAYQGTGDDPGSHAHRGLTKRNAVMFGPAAHLYAYFTYGMHVCANIVCMASPDAAGVLLRAGHIIDGVELARSRRRSATSDRDLARGPARLASALGIALAENGADLLDPAGAFALTLPDHPFDCVTSPRTGVSGTGGSDTYPWRFLLPGEPTVSPYRAAVPRRPRRSGHAAR